MKYLFTAVMLLSLGCGQNAKNTNAAKSTTDTVKALVITKADTNGEYIDWYKVKLNGNLPMLSSFKASGKELGKPDSVVTPRYEDVSVSFFNGKTFKYVYYKGLQFETENDSLAFSRVDFSKNPKLFLTTDKIKLSPATTLDEFKKLFPKSANEALHGTDMDKRASFRLNVAKGNTDDAWILEFDTVSGKLLSVDYFIPD
ncbi:hypothetical protein [Mucilaginibacter celer]|uniref:Lipoprotein n=1 Tax=Mucilaginibacter celer TaxID=2305508 RepID=A0A494W569_9SPHI|nr:hypothetical protein [Mucilaginibacter celer]AYL98442.1 hypothetical protein HYN43_025560 [Mucilaginibacter celer]